MGSDLLVDPPRIAERRENRAVRNVRIRIAAVDDATAMGLVMVESFLSAHRGQMPDAAYQKRVDEWTPDVSARGWAKSIAELSEGTQERGIILVAEDDERLLGLVSGSRVEGHLTGTTCEIGSLYVLPSHRGQGIGGSLLRAAASHLADLGYAELFIDVLSANRPARAFYEAMGGHETGQGTVDEEGYVLPLTTYAWADITHLTRDRTDPPSTPKSTRPN